MSDESTDNKQETTISYGEDKPRGVYGDPSLEEEELLGKCFVGGLSWQTTLDGLKYYFEKFGELKDAALMTDKRTGQPKGFGFVKFKDPAGIEDPVFFFTKSRSFILYNLFVHIFSILFPIRNCFCVIVAAETCLGQ